MVIFMVCYSGVLHETRGTETLDLLYTLLWFIRVALYKDDVCLNVNDLIGLNKVIFQFIFYNKIVFELTCVCFLGQNVRF